MSQLRKSTRKKRQTQLTFSPLTSSSPAAARYPEQFQRRAASVRYDSDTSSPAKRRRIEDSSAKQLESSPLGKPIFGRQKVQLVTESPSEKSGQLPTPAASSQLEVKQERKYQDSSEDDLEILPKSRSESGTCLTAPKPSSTAFTRDGQSSGSVSDEDIAPVQSVRRKNALPTTLSSEDTSDPQTPQKPVSTKRRLKARPKAYTLRTDSSDNSEAGVPTTKLREELSISPQSQRTDGSAAKHTRHPNGRLSSGGKSNAREPIIALEGNGSSSSEDVVVTPARKRRNTAPLQSLTKKAVSHTGSESEDLEDEVNNLQDSESELRSTRTRGKQESSARSIRQQRLEELRRRRAGVKHDTEEESEPVYSDDSETSGPEPIHHAMRRGGDLDEYEEDFVDDDDENLGVEMDAEALRRTIPIEFTRHANKKTIEHFKDEVEWMVHNKLNPAFNRYDEIYEVAHRKLDDEFKGYAGSRYISPVWAPEFDAALKSRPEFSRVEIPTMLEDKCDACRRSKHPPKHKVTFTGKPYDRKTLEPIANHDDGDDSDDTSTKDSNNSEDEQSFFLGRFCCANAEMAHALYHWRYALNQTVLEWLAMHGHLTPARIIERENMRQKKREKSTNRIVDGMESAGVMRELYKEFKENLAAARDSKPTRFSSGR